MWVQFSEHTNKGTKTMKKTTKRYTDTPVEKDVTCTELMEAAVTQCATAKKIVAELKMLLELRKLAHKKMHSRLHEKVLRTK